MNHTMKIVPARETLAELEKNAAALEAAAKNEPESTALALREKAALLREWLKLLSSGRWTS